MIGTKKEVNFLIFLVFTILLINIVSADTITLSSSNYTGGVGCSASPNTHFGIGNTIGTTNGGGDSCRQFIYFNLTFLENKGEIISANYTIFPDKLGSSTNTNITWYIINQTWITSTVTWNSQPSHVNGKTFSIIVNSTNENTRLNSSVTDDVRAWVNGTTTNNGWAIKTDEISGDVVDLDALGITQKLIIVYTPYLTITSPTNQQIINTDSPIVTFNVSSSKNMDVCRISEDQGITNYTLIQHNNTNFGLINTTFKDGPHSILAYCNESTTGIWRTSTNQPSFFVDSVNVTICRDLNVTDRTYNIINDINASQGNCLNVNGNITLQGNNNNLTFSDTSSTGINLFNMAFNFTLHNFRIYYDDSSGGSVNLIDFNGVGDINLNNLTINSTGGELLLAGIINITNSYLESNLSGTDSLVNIQSAKTNGIVSNSKIIVKSDTDTAIGLLATDNFTVQHTTIYSPFRTIDAQSSLNISLINVTYSGGGTDNADTSSNITRFWYFDVQVNDTAGNPLELASVNIKDKFGIVAFDGLTNENGSIATQLLAEYFNNGTKVYKTPYNITVNFAGYVENVTSSNFSSNKFNSIILTFAETTPPLISIVYPIQSANYGAVSELNYTLSDDNIQSCWYSLNLGVTNTTITCGNNITGLNPNYGSNTWTVYANDTFGNYNSSNVSFNYDNITPLINFTNPTLPNNTLLPNNTIIINVTISDEHFNNFNFTWDSTILKIYDKNMIRLLNFNNNSLIGDNLTSAVDISNYAINGTLRNGTEYGPGYYGTAAKFNGETSFILSGNGSDSLDLGFNNFTLATWINPSQINNAYIFSKGVYYGPSTGRYACTIDTTKISCYIYDIPFNYQVTAPISNVPINQWTHLAFTRNTTGIYLFINGKIMSSVAVPTTRSASNNPVPFALGVGYHSDEKFNAFFFNGSIDEFMAWNRTLSPSEIYQLYYSTLYKVNNTDWVFYSKQQNIVVGQHNYSASSGDSFNNFNSTEYRIYTRNESVPQINIIFPVNNTNYTSVNQINFSASAGYGFSTCWYTTNNGLTNTTVSCTQNISLSLSDNNYDPFKLFVNDSFNSINSSQVSFIKDGTPPNLTIVSPQPQAYSSNNVSFNHTVFDDLIGVQSCWYRNDTDASNISINCGTNITLFNSDGTHTIYLWSNDSLGNTAAKSVVYQLSNSAPAITLDYPQDSSYLNSGNSIQFNFTATKPTGVDTCELYGNWSGTLEINQTITSITSGEETNFTQIDLQDGQYIWNVWCNDTLNNGAFALNNFTLTIDSINPQISFGVGTEDNYANLSQSNIFVNVSLTEINFANMTYSLYNSTGLYQSDFYSSVTLTTNWTSLADGNYYYFVNTTDLAGNMNSTGVRNITLDTSNPTAILLSPTNNSFTNNISINFTANVTDPKIQNGTLYVYNSSSLVNKTDINVPQSGVVGVVVNLFENIFKWAFRFIDYAGNLVTTQNNTLTVDLTAPTISILSPTNTTYQNWTIQTNYSTNEALNQTWYSLNAGQSNITFTNNSFITYLSGSNNLTLYAQDLSGNIANKSVIFSVNYTNQLDISLTEEPTPEFGQNISLQATISTFNTNVTSCNFTLTSPTGSSIFSNELGQKNNNIWTSTSSYIISEKGTYNDSVVCTNEFGVTSNVNSSFLSSYQLYYNPINYSFATTSNLTSVNNVTILSYDTVSSTINISVLISMENQSNFTIVNPGSFLLGSSDDVTSPNSYTLSITAKPGIPNNLYTGNITLNNTLDGNETIIPFYFNINIPSGKPVLYSTADIQCTNVYGSLCSNTISIPAGGTNSISYKLKNVGGYDLSNCNFYFSDDLSNVSWISASSSNFGITSLASKDITITISPPTNTINKDYYSYIYTTCAVSNSDSATTDTSVDNRPLQKITITSASGGQQGGGGNNVPSPNITEQIQQSLAGICGNKLCEPAYSENYLSCPIDCTGDLTPITSCLTDPFGDKCTLFRNTNLLYVFSFIVLLVLLSALFEIKRNPNTGTPIVVFSPINTRRKRKR